MALEGTLDDMPLVELLQVILSGGKTGVLMLGGMAQSGVVYAHGGRLLDALLVAGRDRRVLGSGEEAVIALLLWDSGQFTFRHVPEVAGRPARITRSCDSLVLESIRRRPGGGSRLTSQQMGPETRLAPVAEKLGDGVTFALDADHLHVLSRLGHGQDVGSLAVALGMPLARVLTLVSELVAVGVVDVMLPPQGARRTPRREPPPRPQPARALLAAISRRVHQL